MLLSDVCLTSGAYIGPKSRTERPRKTKIGTEVAHVTRDFDITFRVKGQQAALLTAVLRRQAAAVVSVERIRRGKVLLRCICSAVRRHLGAHGGGEGLLCYHL